MIEQFQCVNWIDAYIVFFQVSKTKSKKFVLEFYCFFSGSNKKIEGKSWKTNKRFFIMELKKKFQELSTTNN